ncbi:hypothetical protein ATG_06450 [Desulfurococcaceae archaeon AG1]|nr:hypothetical protein ATG_06450 [Desulfurococcaceae archaeon AG1]
MAIIDTVNIIHDRFSLYHFLVYGSVLSITEKIIGITNTTKGNHGGARIARPVSMDSEYIVISREDNVKGMFISPKKPLVLLFT